MTLVQLHTCDYCNPEGREDFENEVEGIEGWKGWVRTTGEGSPTGWWPVPGMGPDGGMGHACGHCMMTPEVYQDVGEHRQRETERLTGMSPP